MMVLDMVSVPRRRISEYIHRRDKVDKEIIDIARSPATINRIGFVSLPIMSQIHRVMFDLAPERNNNVVIHWTDI